MPGRQCPEKARHGVLSPNTGIVPRARLKPRKSPRSATERTTRPCQPNHCPYAQSLDALLGLPMPADARPTRSWHSVGHHAAQAQHLSVAMTPHGNAPEQPSYALSHGAAPAPASAAIPSPSMSIMSAPSPTAAAGWTQPTSSRYVCAAIVPRQHERAKSNAIC